MVAFPRDDQLRRGCLSSALKAIRRLRGRRQAEVAAAMGMPLRSYEYFESGRGPLNVARIHRFAEVLDADPIAILLGVEVCSSQLAARSARNKLVTILAMALQEFDELAGDDIAQLDAHSLITAFTTMFDGLAAQARERAAFVERWRENRGDPPGAAPEPSPED